MDLPSSTHYINGSFRIIIAFKLHIRIDAWACINVFGTSDSKHCIRPSLCDAGISVIAFRTAPQIGGLSSLKFDGILLIRDVRNTET